MESVGRRTWSAPNKDPFGVEELQKQMDQKFRKNEQLEDPFQRHKSHSGQSYTSSYTPSFGQGGPTVRGRRGGGNAAPPPADRGRYMQELEQQMLEQKMRKEKEEEEAGTDWWEKKPPPSEYKTPHPSQVMWI